MSNRIKTGRLSRRRPPLDHGPLSRPTRDVPPPSTGAGAHFRPARRHVKREQECEPLPAGFCFAQKKRCSLQQTKDSSVELLPPVSWGDAPRNPPPSAKNCLRFEFTKDLKIPPFLPGQVDFDGTLTSDHPRKVTVEKGETLLETRERGTKQWESTISLEVPCMPGPPDTRRDLDLASWKDSSGPTTVSEKVQVSQTSRLLEDHQAVPISHSQARSGPPLQKPDAGAGALPDLASDHLPLQEKLAKGVLDKIHLSSVPAPLVSGKEVQDAKTSHPPSRSCSSSIAPNKKTIKRKLLMPLPLPPPLLLPSLLPWGRNELPPPPKLPRILWEEDLGTSKCKCLKSRKILQGRVDTLKDNVEVLKDKVESLENKVEGLEDKVEALENKVRALENETKAKADQSAPQPASSLVPPVGKTAASLPTTTSTVQVPATVTSTDSGDLSACPPLPSVPLSFPIQKTNEKIIYTTANSLPSAAPSNSLPAYKSNTTSGSPSNRSGGPFPSTSATVPPVSTILTPLPLFKPPACKNESPVPMWIGSPPPPPPPPVHTLPLVLSSGTPIINGVTDMDTTPPSHATIFRSPPNTMGSIIPLPPIQPHIPAMAPVFPGPPPPVAPFPAPSFNQPFGPVATPGPTFWSPNAQQQIASLPSPSGAGGLLIMPPLVAPPSVASTSTISVPMPAFDMDAMDTTPPSKALIFHSPPNASQTYIAHPGTGNMPSSGSIISPQVPSFPTHPLSLPGASTSHPGVIPQPTFVTPNGQQHGGSFWGGNPTAPAPAMGITPPMTHPLSGSIFQPGAAGLTPSLPTVTTPINNQLGTPINNQLGTPINNQLGTPSNNQLGTPSNNQLGMPINNQLGTPVNNQLGTPSNNQLGMPINNQLGTPINNQLGTPSNNQLGMPINNQLGTPVNNQLGTPSNNQLGMPINNQLGTPMNNQLGMPINNQLGTPINNQLGTPINNQLGTPSNNQLGTPSNNLLGTPMNNQLGMPMNNQLGTPINNQLGTPSNNQLGTPSNNQLGTPSNNQLGFNNNTSGAFFFSTAPPSTFQATTNMPGTGNSNLPTASTSQGPLAFMGPAAPLSGGNFGNNTFAQGPSVISGATDQGGQARGTTSTSRHRNRKSRLQVLLH